MFNRARSTRVVASLIIAASLLTASLGTTFGAVPKLGVGGGVNTSFFNATGVTGATPTAVTPGKVAGFYLFAENRDSANVTSFFMTATAAATVTPKGALWSNNPSGPWTRCETSPILKCTFGEFSSGEKIYVIAAYTLPDTPSQSTTNCFTDPGRPTLPANSYGVNPTGASWECVDFQFSANSGNVPGKNKSRGDAYHWFDVVNTDTGGDQKAQFPYCDFSLDTVACDPSLLTISNDQSLGKANPQWTKVQVPNDRVVFNAAQNVADGTRVLQTCPGTPAQCSTAFLGQWSQVDVNSGLDLNTAWIQIDIGVYGVSANKITTVFHFYKDIAGALQLETIDDRCTYSTGPGPVTADPCFWVMSLQGGSSQVTIWTHHNGKFGIG
jgi:hypothetical protein